WVKRRPAAAALVAVSGLAALVLLGVWFALTLAVRAERDRAETNLNMAMQVVDEMLTEMADKGLAKDPDLRLKQEQLLRKALDSYKDFSKQRGEDLAVRKKTALAYQRM